MQGLCLALIGDFKGGELLFLQPLAHGTQGILRLGLVHRLCAAAGGGGQVQRSGVLRQVALVIFIRRFQAEEHFVRLLGVRKAGLVEWLNEVDVEVALGLRRGAVVGRAEEQVAQALDTVLLPLDLVLPDLKAGIAQVVAALHQGLDSAVVGAVERVVGQGFGALIDLGVVVNVFLEIEVVLLCVRCFGDELAVDGFQHLAHNGLHHREQVFGGLAGHVFDAGLKQAQGVAQLGGGGANGNVDVAAGGQAVYGQTIDNTQRHRLVGRAREGLLNAGFEHFGNAQHLLDVGIGFQHRVALDRAPETLKGDQLRAVGGHVLIEDGLHGGLDGLERAALFGEVNLLEGLEVVRVNGEQTHVFVHAFVHRAIELGKRREVFANLVLLVGSLLEQTCGDDEAHVLTVDQDLREALVDAADAVGHVLEAAIVENGLLHARDEAEFQVFGDFADLAQDGQVEYQFVVAARLQVFEELVHHQQQALVREFLTERGHHLLEGVFVV